MSVVSPVRALIGAAILLAGVPLSAQSPPLPAVIDPAQPVPPLVYRSVFDGVARGVESGSVDWRKANDEVGQFRRGHIDILKWEQQQDAAPPAGGAPRPVPGHRGHGATP